nr:hypothetical protein [Tanacetum cinerariifolium]
SHRVTSLILEISMMQDSSIIVLLVISSMKGDGNGLLTGVHIFVKLSQLQVPILSDDIEDTVVWISENDNEKKFKISNVWKDMNCHEEKVD